MQLLSKWSRPPSSCPSYTPSDSPGNVEPHTVLRLCCVRCHLQERGVREAHPVCLLPCSSTIHGQPQAPCIDVSWSQRCACSQLACRLSFALLAQAATSFICPAVSSPSPHTPCRGFLRGLAPPSPRPCSQPSQQPNSATGCLCSENSPVLAELAGEELVELSVEDAISDELALLGDVLWVGERG